MNLLGQLGAGPAEHQYAGNAVGSGRLGRDEAATPETSRERGGGLDLRFLHDLHGYT
jgi:hypothetical protein